MLFMLNGAVTKIVVMYRSLYCPEDPKDRDTVLGVNFFAHFLTSDSRPEAL